MRPRISFSLRHATSNTTTANCGQQSAPHSASAAALTTPGAGAAGPGGAGGDGGAQSPSPLSPAGKAGGGAGSNAFAVSPRAGGAGDSIREDGSAASPSGAEQSPIGDGEGRGLQPHPVGPTRWVHPVPPRREPVRARRPSSAAAS